MRIAALADLHGHFPTQIPECDVVVIAGDIVLHDNENPRRIVSQYIDFRDWLTELRNRAILPIGVAGNHDFAIQEIPNFAKKFAWVYLEDSGFEYRGLNFYGTPWQPWMGGWAFNAPENELADPDEPFLNERFQYIPSRTDVVITHTPPAGFHDTIKGAHRGSISLNKHIERVDPRLVVYGHIHKPGVEQIGGTTLCNASYVGFDRRPNGHPIQLFDI